MVCLDFLFLPDSALVGCLLVVGYIFPFIEYLLTFSYWIQNTVAITLLSIWIFLLSLKILKDFFFWQLSHTYQPNLFRFIPKICSSKFGMFSTTTKSLLFWGLYWRPWMFFEISASWMMRIQTSLRPMWILGFIQLPMQQ